MAKVYGFVGKIGTGIVGSANGAFNCLATPSVPAGGIAADANYIFVADTANHRVQIFNNSSPWAYVGQIGTTGVPSATNGQLSSPVDVVTDGTSLWVLENGNMRIQKFTISTLAYVEKVAITGITTVWGMADDATYLYVAAQDAGVSVYLHRYTKSPLVFSNNLALVQLGQPCDIAIDSTYWYGAYDSATSSRRNTLFTETGTNFGSGVNNRGIANDTNYIYVSETNRIAAYDISTLAFTDYFGAAGAANGYFNTPTRLAYYNNQLFVNDAGNYRIQIFDWSTKVAPAAPSGLTLACVAGSKILVSWTDNS